jgi:hypothetical protein
MLSLRPDTLIALAPSGPPMFRGHGPSLRSLFQADQPSLRVTARRQNLPGTQVSRAISSRLAEHWDVLPDEATSTQSLSGLPMFGNRFPD